MEALSTPRSSIGEFCKAVCSFVRFWPDHDAITAELTAHMEDHRDALLERNPALSPEEAEERAVAAMGDPEALGRELDKSHNPLPGWFQILFRVSVRTGLVLLLVFCFLPKATDLFDLITDPPLYNDDDTGVIVEHYDQVEVLLSGALHLLGRAGLGHPPFSHIYRGTRPPGERPAQSRPPRSPAAPAPDL